MMPMDVVVVMELVREQKQALVAALEAFVQDHENGTCSRCVCDLCTRARAALELVGRKP